MKKPRFTLTLAMARALLLPEHSDELKYLSNVEFTEAGAKVLLENVPLIVEQQQIVVTQREMESEKKFGLANLAFLTKLHNVNMGTGSEGPEGLKARIACASHIFTAQDQKSAVSIDDLRSWRAYTVFGFGDREFDNLFEMGDGDQVHAAMMKLSQTSRSAASVCANMGWNKESTTERSRG